MRNWTDEQDEVAYYIFRTEANRSGIEPAKSLMERVQSSFDLSFGPLDINAWVYRYQDEH